MTLTIQRPNDMHVHLRAEPMLGLVLPYTALRFGRAVVMPNAPAVETAADLEAYRADVLEAAAREGFPDFEPLMTFMVTPRTTPDVVRDCRAAGAVAGKVYPNGLTTGSEGGFDDLRSLYPAFAAMEAANLVLCVHGEKPGPLPERFEHMEGASSLVREEAILPELAAVVRAFPKLRLVLEHVTSAAGVDWVLAQPPNVAATITAHHPFLTQDDVLGGGDVGREHRLHPHHYCAPMPKRLSDRTALRRAAISGSRKFFLGTDSAPHPARAKEAACGCAGVFNPFALEILAELFAANRALDRLEGFASVYGPWFYGLPANRGHVTLERAAFEVPREIARGGLKVVPFMAGLTVYWRLADAPADPPT